MQTTAELQTVSVEEVSAMDNYKKVNVSIKVITVNAPDTVSDLPHQDVGVADRTGSVRVCLWDNHVNALKEGQLQAHWFHNTGLPFEEISEYA